MVVDLVNFSRNKKKKKKKENYNIGILSYSEQELLELVFLQYNVLD